MKEDSAAPAIPAMPIPLEQPLPMQPLALTISGLYIAQGSLLTTLDATIDELTETGESTAGDVPIAPLPAAPKIIEELRLDVDGAYPQMAASGSIPVSNVQRLHWIARLSRVNATTYRGRIWYKHPTTVSFGYSQVTIAITSVSTANRTAKVTFQATGLPNIVRSYRFRSPTFRYVAFEYDAVDGIAPVTAINTCGHPNRPGTLPCERLTIEKVFNRAGFHVLRSGDSPIPIAGAGPNTTWSDAEMHDAMQTYWSRFANVPQWALWVFFANRHDTGASLGGIMFDDIGPNHRQGTAIFYDSFISQVPAGDPSPADYQARMRMWTAVHEMGHAFNLAHSWQKSLGTPWVPLADEPEARSFMNYPFRVAGGPSAFFANFEYRFSNHELLFMRHAPERFVRMGDADWFDNHAFREVARHPDPPLALELRVNRSKPTYEFLEPVVIEVKVKNVSTDPQIVDENIVNYLDNVTLAIKRQGSPARQYIPYARYCARNTPKVLIPGEAMYGSVFVSAGLNGLDVAEPGSYLLQACLHSNDGDIVSAPLILRIAPPQTRDEELIAQDYLRDDVGRMLAFDGSRVMTSAIDTLREVSTRLANRRVARHAQVALGTTLAQDFKVIEAPQSLERTMRPAAALDDTRIVVQKAENEEAADALATALTENTDVAAETLGHIDYTDYVETLVDTLTQEGQRKQAAQVLSQVAKTLAARGVLKKVVSALDAQREALATGAGR